MDAQRGAGPRGTSRTAGLPPSEMIFCVLPLTSLVQHDKVAWPAYKGTVGTNPSYLAPAVPHSMRTQEAHTINTVT